MDGFAKTSPSALRSAVCRSRGIASASAVLAFALLSGCSGGREGTQKELDDLRATIVKLRADQSVLAERLDSLELTRNATTAPRPSAGDRPDLDVVRLGPERNDEPDVDGPRPVVRAVGSNGGIENLAASRPPGPERDLDVALDLYKARKLDKAIEGFASFLARYPDGTAAETATFFRAECYAAKSDPRRAIEQFEAVVANFPRGTRAPEALLRVSQNYQKLGDRTNADDAKRRLFLLYPTSETAKKLPKPPPENAQASAPAGTRPKPP